MKLVELQATAQLVVFQQNIQVILSLEHYKVEEEIELGIATCTLDFHYLSHCKMSNNSTSGSLSCDIFVA